MEGKVQFKGENNIKGMPMEYFLQLLGDKSIGWAVSIICLVIFLTGCYKRVEKFFVEKAIQEKEKNELLQNMIEQANKYPEWHKQSIDIRSELSTNISELGEKIDLINESIMEAKKENEEERANSWRYRILRFDDEVRHDRRHSKEHFDQILDDITGYKNYCRDHPEYKNSKAVLATENIERIYRKCCEEDSFL